MTTTTPTTSSFVGTFLQLWSVPLLLLITVAALDSADKSLLAASFPILQKELGMNVESLGYFSLFSNLSYALALPFWAHLVHSYSISNAHNILAVACGIWGLATFGIASTYAIHAQALYRCINGAALASILPLSQTMLVELVPSNARGRAFGLLGLAEKAAATIAVAAVVWCNDWRIPYIIVGTMSILVAVVGRRQLKMPPTAKEKNDIDQPQQEHLTFTQIVRRISEIPAFTCLVGQGIFGSIPWDMMSFLLLLLDWKGFTKDQIVMVQFTNGIAGTIGGALGGILGDWFAVEYDLQGRIAVAFISVVSGTLFYGMFLFTNSYVWSLVWSNLFHLAGSWTPAATNRPLCAQLAKNPSERAQIVAAWILMEKTSAAVFGAPLVGYITRHMMMIQDNDNEQQESNNNDDKARTLAFNIFWLSTFFWTICAAFWLLMAYLMKRQDTYERVAQTEGKSRV